MERRQFLKLSASIGLVRLLPATAQDVGHDSAVPELGRRKLTCLWQERKHGQYIGDLTANNPRTLQFTHLFVNGSLQILARFPNAEPAGAAVFLGAVRFLPPCLLIPDPQDDDNPNDLLAIEFNPATFSQKRWGNPQDATLCLKRDSGVLRLPVRFVDYDRNLLWFAPGRLGGVRS